MPWYEILTSNYEAWAAKPLPSIIALILGAYGGYLLSRLRHQGRIETLEERIKHKDEQIAVKDNAIESLADMPKPMPKGRARVHDHAYVLVPRRHDLKETEAPNQVRPAEPQVGENADAAIRDTITRTKYRFVFNPSNDLSKTLTFLPNGMIGEGCNNNEATWRISKGKVEILDGAGSLYSRFNLLQDGRSLHHTNEPDTRSLRGQYMVPIDLPLLRPTVHG